MSDGDLYPYATGEAAKTVEQHSAPQDLVLWAGWFCPFVHRSWIALEEKEIAYQYKEVNPFSKDVDFLKISPKGHVPAIEYNSRPLCESLIICEFLEDAFPNHRPLLPIDPLDRGEARISMDNINKTIVSGYFRLIMSQGDEKQSAALSEFEEALRRFAEKVKGPYFFGDQWTLVDTALAPWVVRDFVARDFRGYKRENVSAKWAAYAEMLETRESVLRTSSDKEQYLQTFGQYLRDEAQTSTAKAVRAGRDI